VTRRRPGSATTLPERVRRRRRQRGQTLVEFALVIPIFLMGVFGLIDGSRLVFLNSTLSEAAREGAREASVEASWLGSGDASCNTTGGPICPATLDILKSHVLAAVNHVTPLGAIPSSGVAMSCDASTPPTGTWTGQTCTSNDTGSYVSVRVFSTFTPLTPVIGQILGAITLSGSATMTIN
jgi:Flp pilus assembly protein TadG